MISIAVTGGVACGKTLVCERFLEMVPEGTSYRFSSDECVGALLETAPVLKKLRKMDDTGEIVTKNGLNKKVLRERAFENSEIREKLESILHPLVLEQASAFIKSHSGKAALLLIEVPLLYEVDFPLPRDMEMVVAASRVTQVKRLSQERGLESDLANRIIDSQMPLEEKISRSDVVVWNDSQVETLDAQIRHLASRCSILFN